MEGSESILPCTRDLVNRNNRECAPFSMTGTELLARLRQWLIAASDYTDGMNATTKVFFDEIKELCKERQLNIRIFHNKNVEEDGEIHHMVQRWMREHLPTLREEKEQRSHRRGRPCHPQKVLRGLQYRHLWWSPSSSPLHLEIPPER